MRNFQIVNGGQTTASIHVALRNKDVDLDKVFVQMELSIVNSDRAMEVVPKISEYANTQNRVSAADFFSNHPFHIRIETFSRRLYTPSKEGWDIPSVKMVLRAGTWPVSGCQGPLDPGGTKEIRP